MTGVMTLGEHAAELFCHVESDTHTLRVQIDTVAELYRDGLILDRDHQLFWTFIHAVKACRAVIDLGDPPVDTMIWSSAYCHAHDLVTDLAEALMACCWLVRPK